MDLDDDLLVRKVPEFDRRTWIGLAIIALAVVIITALMFLTPLGQTEREFSVTATAAALQE